MAAGTYGANGGMAAPTQQLMTQLSDEVCVQRKINKIELCGLEGKNQYELFHGHTTKDQHVGWTREESAFCDRCFCGPGRELTFFTHIGGPSNAGTMQSVTKEDMGPLAMKLHKQRHYPCCWCCSRPHATLSDADGHHLGTIEDPCTCCSVNHLLLDASGKQKYEVKGSLCQCGVFYPCCGDVNLHVNENGKEVGKMTRLAFSFTELCCPTQRFTVKFPKGSEPQDRALLIGSQMMMDVSYFDNSNQSQNAVGGLI